MYEQVTTKSSRPNFKQMELSRLHCGYGLVVSVCKLCSHPLLLTHSLSCHKKCSLHRAHPLLCKALCCHPQVLPPTCPVDRPGSPHRPCSFELLRNQLLGFVMLAPRRSSDHSSDRGVNYCLSEPPQALTILKDNQGCSWKEDTDPIHTHSRGQN